MTISDRDRRALLLLGFAVIGVLVFQYVTDAAPAGTTASPQDSIELAEKRLVRLRQVVAQVPSRQEQHKLISDQLATREKRVMQADTAAQAQAALLATVRRVTRAQNPSIDIRSSEFGAVKAFGSDYAEVPVTVTIECGIEQLLNILTELTIQPELAAVSDLRVYSANQKQKTTNVRLQVTGIVPKRLLPERKGAF